VLALDEAQQLLVGVLLFDNGVADVGPVKAADKQPRVLQLQALHDVGAGQASAVAVSAMRGTPA
jgi:hypothetical protein